MIDQLLPLTTFEIINPDFSEADRRAEMIRYVDRQRAIAACLDGKEHPDVVLDLLESHSIDPLAYVEGVEETIELIICQGFPVGLQ